MLTPKRKIKPQRHKGHKEEDLKENKEKEFPKFHCRSITKHPKKQGFFFPYFSSL